MLSFATVVELTAITKSWKSIKNSAKTCWRSHIRRREIVKIILHERVKKGVSWRDITLFNRVQIDAVRWLPGDKVPMKKYSTICGRIAVIILGLYL